MTFATAVHISFSSFVYRTNVFWSVIHGIKRKSHLSVEWNWYHFVAIANLHQPRPTDSADINTRLQLSDTNSVPPMHGGFLLVFAFWQKWMLHLYIKPSYSFNWTRLSISVLHKWRINIYKRRGSFFNLIRLYFPELFYRHCVNHTLALIQVKHDNTEYVYTSNSDPLKFRLWSKSNTERQEGEHILWGFGTSMHYKSMVSVWKWHKIIHSSYAIVQSFLILSRLYILILHYS